MSWEWISTKTAWQRYAGQSGFNVVVGDAETLDMDGKYDYVVAGELIEHLLNPGAFLAAAKGWIAEGGTLIITTPNP